jgi:hypothetical protein
MPTLLRHEALLRSSGRQHNDSYGQRAESWNCFGEAIERVELSLLNVERGRMHEQVTTTGRTNRL